MPAVAIMNKGALPLFKSFREYSAFVVRFYPDRVLEQDIVFKYFQKVIDCPDTYWTFIEFWRDAISTQFKETKL